MTAYSRLRLPKVVQSKLTFNYFLAVLRLNHYDYTNWEYWHKEYKNWLIGEIVSVDTEKIMYCLEECIDGNKNII